MEEISPDMAQAVVSLAAKIKVEEEAAKKAAAEQEASRQRAEEQAAAERAEAQRKADEQAAAERAEAQRKADEEAAKLRSEAASQQAALLAAQRHQVRTALAYGIATGAPRVVPPSRVPGQSFSSGYKAFYNMPSQSRPSLHPGQQPVHQMQMRIPDPNEAVLGNANAQPICQQAIQGLIRPAQLPVQPPSGCQPLSQQAALQQLSYYMRPEAIAGLGLQCHNAAGTIPQSQNIRPPGSQQILQQQRNLQQPPAVVKPQLSLINQETAAVKSGIRASASANRTRKFPDDENIPPAEVSCRLS